jgi:multicomponent Na+:H+ antiporter subunit F
MTQDLYLVLAIAVMISFAGGAVRLLRGPHRTDRMMGAQLFGTTGATLLMILAAAMDAWALLDVALVFAALAAVTVIAFVQRATANDDTGVEEGEL